MFRRISYKDWALVQSLFPKAICFRERRQLSGESGTDEDEATCLECEAKDSEDDNRLRRIKELVVCSKDTVLSDVSLKVALASSHKQYRIVHSGDVDAWKRLTTSVEGRGRGARLASADQAARFLAPKVSCARTLLSRDCESEPGLSDQRLRALASFLRPIVCESHGMPIETAIFRRQSSGDESRRELSDRIVIMEQNVYEEYVSNLVMAALILSPLGESEYPANRTLADDSKDAEDFIREFNLLDLLHPTFLARPASRELARTSSAIVGEFGGNEVLFDLSPGVCSDPACCSRFADWDNAEYGIDTATRAGVAEAIIVDSDIEEVADPTCMLRVFEIKADANAEDEYHNLAQCAGAAITDDTPSIGLGFFPRRSSRRKRKAPSYPVGAVMGDVAIQTSLAHNLAALRLTMMEACTDFELNHSLKFFVLRPDPFDAFVEESNILEYNSTRRILRSRVLDLPFQLNHQTLRNVCEDLLLEKLGPDFNPSEHLFIVRQSSIDLTSLDTGHDELFQVLIDASNNKDASVSRSGNGQRSGRSSKAPERGFRGTLLTGSARDESSAKDDDDAKPSASATTESNAAVGNNSRAAESTQGSPPLANRGSDGVHLKSPSVWNGRADASGIVVLDDNEDHDMDSSSPSRMLVETENDVPRGGFGPPGAPYRATPPPGKRHRDARVYAPISTANVIDVADSDSSDGDSLFNAPSLVRRSPQKTPPPRQQQPRQDRRSSTAAPPIPSPSGRRGVFGRGKDLDPETLIAKVAHALQRSQLGGDDQQLDAASYAVQNNPGCQDIDKLVVVAEFKLGELAGFYK